MNNFIIYYVRKYDYYYFLAKHKDEKEPLNFNNMRNYPSYLTYNDIIQYVLGFYSKNEIAWNLETLMFIFNTDRVKVNDTNVRFDTEEEAESFIDRLDSYRLTQIL